MVNLRSLTVEDIGEALELSGAERWNQTENDWKFLINTPENICLAAVSDGTVVGTATATNYNNEIAWIGMVLVNKNYRGKGISKLLLSRLFQKLNHCRSIKLDATPAGQPVYQKFGFKNEYKILRLTNSAVSPIKLNSDCLSEIEKVTNENITEVVLLDNKTFGTNRKNLVEYLIRNSPSHSYIMKRDGKITGFVLGRKGVRFYQIGPVTALSAADAKRLILKTMEKLADMPVVVDVLESDKELLLALTSLGFDIQRPFYRMFQNDNPYPGISEKQFLICGPEFG